MKNFVVGVLALLCVVVSAEEPLTTEQQKEVQEARQTYTATFEDGSRLTLTNEPCAFGYGWKATAFIKDQVEEACWVAARNNFVMVKFADGIYVYRQDGFAKDRMI